MRRIGGDVKTYIVQQLAFNRTPSEIAKLVNDEFDVVVDRRYVQRLDPYRAGEKPAAKWQRVFAAARKALLAGAIGDELLNKNFRAAALADLFKKARARGDMKFAASLLEQAAREAGGLYVNAHTRPDERDPGEFAASVRSMLSEMDRVTTGKSRYGDVNAEPAEPAETVEYE